jgi:hypothetical protein
MSFISFSLDYYKNKIEQYESHPCNAHEVYEAKQLLKMIDDLVDEGYTDLFDEINRNYGGIARLHKIIVANKEEPFVLEKSIEQEITFDDEQKALDDYLEELITHSLDGGMKSTNPFLGEITAFCDWVGDVKDQAYVFLLRDALLPYIHFKAMHRPDIYPWIIGRKYMDLISPGNHIDDVIRGSFFDALESGCDDFESFQSFCKEKILSCLEPYPEVIGNLKEFLSTIKASKILVIESGCYGTFPMVLSVLDERVDFKMFTTVPFLFNIYKERIFTRAYEKIRLFETLYSQDRLFQLTAIKNNHFYIGTNRNELVINKSLEEIRKILEQ